MGKQNPHGAKSPPEPVEIRCTVCGNEWETIAEYPQCHDPDTTEVSCGRSREWEYVNLKDDPYNEENVNGDSDDSDESINDGNTSADNDGDMGGTSDGSESDDNGGPNQDDGKPESEASNKEGKSEPKSDSNVETNESDSTDDMVTQEEYDQFHGESSSKDSEPSRARDNESGADADTDSGSGGFSLPVERNTLIIGGIAIVGLLALYFLVIRPRSQSAESSGAMELTESDADSTESLKGEDTQDVSVEKSDSGEVQIDPVEDGQMVEPRSPAEVPLFEGDQ